MNGFLDLGTHYVFGTVHAYGTLAFRDDGCFGGSATYDCNPVRRTAPSP